MSEQVTLSLGTTVGISPDLPRSYDEAGFLALSYTLIKGVRDAGDINEQHNTITRSPLGLDYSYQERVGFVLPTLSWDIVRLKGNVGQGLLKEAIFKPAHSFRIEHADGEQLFFTATVRTRRRIIVDGSTISAWRYELDLQSKIVEVD